MEKNNTDQLDFIEVKITCGCGHVIEGLKKFALEDFETHLLEKHFNKDKKSG